MNPWIYAALAALVAVTFVAMWWFDARRAAQVEHDPERLEQAPGRRRWRRERVNREHEVPPPPA